MLDTNICIYAIKGGNTHLDQQLDECEIGDLVMSAITLGKPEAGSSKGTAPVPLGNKQRLSFKRSPSSLPTKPPRAFGQVQSETPARRGAYDRQIAAHAISLGLTVVTNNEQDSKAFRALAIDNWTKTRARPGPDCPTDLAPFSGAARRLPGAR